MEIGETWAYRERARDLDCPFQAVEIIQFGPLRSNKVRVRMCDGEYPGLDAWVPKIRLVVPWDGVETCLRDECAYEAAREASLEALDTPEHEAAWLVSGVHPEPDGILIGYGRSDGAIVEIANPEKVLPDLGFDIGTLLADPLAFLDGDGQFVGPWSVAKRIVTRVAERYTKRVLSAVAKEEAELREDAIHGKYVEITRGDERYLPAEHCAEILRKREPAFAVARSWCGQAAVETFDEVAALRAEVDRLRKMIDDTAERLEARGLDRDARGLRRRADLR